MPALLSDTVTDAFSSAPTVTQAPLSAEQIQQVAAAHARAKKIRKAAQVANFNAWVSAVLAACAVPFALTSFVDLIGAVGLGWVAYTEFRGRRMLLKFDPNGAKVLGWNQLVLLGLILAYCTYRIIVGFTMGSPFTKDLTSNPEVAALLGSAEELEALGRVLTLVLYGGTIFASAIFQGLTAAYYFSRKKLLDTYLRETPPWVVTLQQTTALN